MSDDVSGVKCAMVLKPSRALNKSYSGLNEDRQYKKPWLCFAESFAATNASRPCLQKIVFARAEALGVYARGAQNTRQ
jgi:hypothetical protein